MSLRFNSGEVDPYGCFANDALLRNWRQLTRSIVKIISPTPTCSKTCRKKILPLPPIIVLIIPGVDPFRSPCPVAANHGYLPAMAAIYPRDLLFALFVMLQGFMGTRISLSPLDHSYSFEWPASVVAASISKIPPRTTSSNMLIHLNYGNHEAHSPARPRSRSLSVSPSLLFYRHIHPPIHSSLSFQLPFPLSPTPIHFFRSSHTPICPPSPHPQPQPCPQPCPLRRLRLRHPPSHT